MELINTIYKRFIEVAKTVKATTSKEDEADFYPEHLISKPKCVKDIKYIVLGDYECAVLYIVPPINNVGYHKIGITTEETFNEIMEEEDSLGYIRECLFDESDIVKSAHNEGITEIINIIRKNYLN